MYSAGCPEICLSRQESWHDPHPASIEGDVDKRSKQAADVSTWSDMQVLAAHGVTLPPPPPPQPSAPAPVATPAAGAAAAAVQSQPQASGSDAAAQAAAGKPDRCVSVCCGPKTFCCSTL